MLFLIGCTKPVYPLPTDYFNAPIMERDFIVVSWAERNELILEEYIVVDITPNNVIVAVHIPNGEIVTLAPNEFKYSKQIVVRYRDCSIHYEQNTITCQEE